MKHNNTKRGFRHARRALERAWLAVRDADTREVISEELVERCNGYAARKGRRLFS
jgi:uncharacterized protein YecT (DUF1311 family)